ncbi:MAG: hypothetical protein KIS74_02905 [Burkholderiales bacterium]|nr:hypothetical protein [Burkholderiales bacterium]
MTRYVVARRVEGGLELHPEMPRPDGWESHTAASLWVLMKWLDPEWTVELVQDTQAVADVLWLDSLDEATKERLARIYGTADPGPDGAFYTEAQLQEAYEAGWEDGQDAVEIDTNSPSDHDFRGFLKTIAHQKGTG